VGKKAVMAVTGLMGFAFVVAHLVGNLQFYLGPEALNDYSSTLRSHAAVLLAARFTLLVAVILHFIAAFQLWRLNRAARPLRYLVYAPQKSTYASRTMMLSGPILFLFILYHLLHLTFGRIHPSFRHMQNGVPDTYHNLVIGFSNPFASGAYILAMLFLGFHLRHGIWSLFQSLGWNHPRYMPLLRRFALIGATLIVLGNISIPIAVMLGFHNYL
jgi:succinate dehydrogenase / fumarate reductase cytochrome b subunit